MNTDVQDDFFYNIKRYKGLIYYAGVLKFEAILDQISSCRNNRNIFHYILFLRRDMGVKQEVN
jgi:hypothetical protein